MLMFVDLITRLSQANVIIGIILCSIGLGLVLLSRKYVGTQRGGREIQEDDKAILLLRAMGLIMIVVAMIVMIIY
ncbi:MAG: hypothetical protein IKT27_00550 [Clostridia bacterium]|nr:hypothetical protein [Clostridia bacterium]